MLYVTLQCYVSAEDWKSAFTLAESIGPAAQQSVARQRRLVHQTRGDAQGLLENGDVEGALNLLAANKEWEQCFAIAKKHAHPLLPQLLKERVEVSILGGLDNAYNHSKLSAENYQILLHFRALPETSASKAL